MTAALKYKENLPNDCPLSDSAEHKLSDVWRFLEASSPTAESFASHAALGKPVPKNVCGCRWSSCSLFKGDEVTASMLKLQMYKRFSGRAELRIPAGSGRSIEKANHVDFWAYSSFDFISSIVKVEVK